MQQKAIEKQITKKKKKRKQSKERQEKQARNVASSLTIFKRVARREFLKIKGKFCFKLVNECNLKGREKVSLKFPSWPTSSPF
jgi:hypothetical protein